MRMTHVFHMTSGDSAGAALARSGVPGEVFVWHDILYDGPREPGWPTDEILEARARFIESETGGGLDAGDVRRTLDEQYRKLATASEYDKTVLWFDACLFDQAMLCHILARMLERNITNVELLCVDAFDGIEPYDGIGQLSPAQLASVYDDRTPVTQARFAYAAEVDAAFATRDVGALTAFSQADDAPLRWVPAAAHRWLQERPSPDTGLGRLHSLVMEALADGHATPEAILAYVRDADGHPRYWSDFMLWAKINGLADRTPPLVKIDGPVDHLPQWEEHVSPSEFRVTAVGG